MRSWVMLACALLITGCASAQRGDTDRIYFNSEPKGASVLTSNGLQCTTPCALTVSRRDEFSATVSKPGFVTHQVFVKAQISTEGAAGVAGNVLLGGLVGVGVDAATGAALDHCPNPVSVILQPKGKPPGQQLVPHCGGQDPSETSVRSEN